MKKGRKYSAREVATPEDNYPFPWQFKPKNYSDLYLMSCVPESQVQRDIVQLLKTYRIDAVEVDAGGRRARGRVAAMASSLGLETGRLAAARTGGEIPRGFSDLEATLAPSGRALYIEVKAPAWCDQGRRFLRSAGAPTEEQLEFLLAKHKRGAVVLVAWSAEDVRGFLGPLLVANRKALVG
jgi:hypothetical protein